MNLFGIAAILLVCLVCGPVKAKAQEKESYCKTIGIKMVEIPAGNFGMGCDMDNDNLPVEKASWFEAIIFCNKLSALEGLDSCYMTTDQEDYFGQNHRECDLSKNGFRLPTEAEWEYACRAGTTTNYYTGDNESDLDHAGWYRKNCDHRTHPVAQKKPNAWGLYDMHGNVWEWCNDWYYQNYNNSSSNNPTGPESGHDHVLRGGSWPDNAGYCRSANRCMIRPSYKNFGIGFRVVYRP